MFLEPVPPLFMAMTSVTDAPPEFAPKKINLVYIQKVLLNKGYTLSLYQVEELWKEFSLEYDGDNWVDPSAHNPHWVFQNLLPYLDEGLDQGLEL